MSDRLPSLNADEVIWALKKAGFEVTCIKGSHHVMGKVLIAACCARSSPTLI